MKNTSKLFGDPIGKALLCVIFVVLIALLIVLMFILNDHNNVKKNNNPSEVKKTSEDFGIILISQDYWIENSSEISGNAIKKTYKRTATSNVAITSVYCDVWSELSTKDKNELKQIGIFSREDCDNMFTSSILKKTNNEFSRYDGSIFFQVEAEYIEWHKYSSGDDIFLCHVENGFMYLFMYNKSINPAYLMNSLRIKK